MAISKRVRFEVFKRDEFQCQYCGRTPPGVVLECDHIFPVSLGGDDDFDNLTTACFDCNRGKSNILVEQVVADSQTIAEKRRLLKEKHDQVKAFNEFQEEVRQYEDQLIDNIGEYWFDTIYNKDAGYVFASREGASIRRFLKSLSVQEIKEAMDLALSKKRATPDYWDHAWKYFCGICWNKIREAKGGETAKD